MSVLKIYRFTSGPSYRGGATCIAASLEEAKELLNEHPDFDPKTSEVSEKEIEAGFVVVDYGAL